MVCERGRCKNGSVDGHEIEDERRALADLGEGERCDVEEGDVEPKQSPSEQKTKGASRSAKMSKSSRRVADTKLLAHDDIGDDERNESEKSDHASGP